MLSWRGPEFGSQDSPRQFLATYSAIFRRPKLCLREHLHSHELRHPTLKSDQHLLPTLLQAFSTPPKLLASCTHSCSVCLFTLPLFPQPGSTRMRDHRRHSDFVIFLQIPSDNVLEALHRSEINLSCLLPPKLALLVCFGHHDLLPLNLHVPTQLMPEFTVPPHPNPQSYSVTRQSLLTACTSGFLPCFIFSGQHLLIPQYTNDRLLSVCCSTYVLSALLQPVKFSGKGRIDLLKKKTFIISFIACVRMFCLCNTCM